MPDVPGGDPEAFEPLDERAGGHPGDPDDEASLDEALPEAPLRAVVEALLFAADEPLTADDAAAVLGEDRRAEIETVLKDLRADLERSPGGLRVQAVAGGYRLTTDPVLGPYLRAFVRSRNRQRLSRAALETLAVIAYKQPITAPEIQEIRGVNPSAILASLLDRRLVRILGRKKVVGKPFVYGTTKEFLIRFGLNSVEDLPSMEEFEAMLQESPEEPAADPAPPNGAASPDERPEP